MSKRGRRVRDRLTAVRDGQDLVLLERRGHLDQVEGYVVEVGEKWLTVAVLDASIVLNGHAFLRIDDVKRVRGRNNADMVRQALTHRRQWPPAPPRTSVDLDDTRALLESLAEEPLVTIMPEGDDPDVCYIGAPVRLGARSYRLLEVTPRGVWSTKATKHRIDAISRVEIGGQYEQALLLVAGPVPHSAASRTEQEDAVAAAPDTAARRERVSDVTGAC